MKQLLLIKYLVRNVQQLLRIFVSKFYNLVALPVIGVYLVAIQIMTCDTRSFLGCFCQFKHKVTIEMLSLRNFVTDIGTDKRFRNMPILMPAHC